MPLIVGRPFNGTTNQTRNTYFSFCIDFIMGSLGFFSVTIILIAILLMAAQNMTLLSGKWKNYYIGLLLVKLILTYINANYPGVIPMSGMDSVAYSRHAITIVEQCSDNFFAIFQGDDTFFAKVLATVYYFVGSNFVVGYYFVCFCSLIAFQYMVLMAKEMTEDDELAQKCGILLLAWPILLIHASTCLRENQCNLLFIVSFYNFVRFVKKHRQINFVGSIFWAILAAMTHSGMIALVICYCIFGSMVSKSGEIKFSPVKIAFGFILILGLMSSSFSDNMTEKFKGAEDAQSIEEFSSVVSIKQASSAATMYISSTPSNPIKLLLLEPYLFLMFVFSPLPYQIHSFGQGISFLLESIPQFILVRSTFIYLVKERNEGTPQIRGYKTMGLWILLLFYFIFSLGTTCYGTAIRHRAKITPLLIVFMVMYTAEKKGISVGSKKEEQKDGEEQDKESQFGMKAPSANSKSRFGKKTPLPNPRLMFDKNTPLPSPKTRFGEKFPLTSPRTRLCEKIPLPNPKSRLGKRIPLPRFFLRNKLISLGNIWEIRARISRFSRPNSRFGKRSRRK